MSFTAFECVTIEVYDYMEFEGARYWATERYRPQMNARSEWAYTLQLHGIEGLAAQTLMVNPTDGKDDPIVMLHGTRARTRRAHRGELEPKDADDRLEGRRSRRL